MNEFEVNENEEQYAGLIIYYRQVHLCLLFKSQAFKLTTGLQTNTGFFDGFE